MMIISNSKPNAYGPLKSLGPSDSFTLSSQNRVDSGDKVIISGIRAGLSAIPAVGAAVDLASAWGSRNDSKLSSGSFLAAGLLNGAGTISLVAGLCTGNTTATRVGLGMVLSSPVAAAVGAWNDF